MKTKFHIALLALITLFGAVQETLGFYCPSTGRWLSKDPIGDSPLVQGRLLEPEETVDENQNLYRFVDNNPISNIDPFGLSIWTRESSTTFQDAIKAALEKVSGASLCWQKDGSGWKLIVTNKGSGKLFNDLNTGIKASTKFTIHRGQDTGNAQAQANWWRFMGRDVEINENVNVPLPLQGGGTRNVGLDVILWHELVGHAILKNRHPQEKWNTSDYRFDYPLPQGWGKVDPTIAIENEARSKLGIPPRRSQYYDSKSQWR